MTFSKRLPCSGWLVTAGRGVQKREGYLAEVVMTTWISGYGGLLTVLMSIKRGAAGSKLLTTPSCGLTSRRKCYSKVQPKEVQKMLIHKDRGQTRKTFNCAFYQDSNHISYGK